jgi:hypothetical protein
MCFFPADQGVYSIVCEVDVRHNGPCILRSPALNSFSTQYQLCINYSLSSANTLLTASLLSSNSAVVFNHRLPSNSSYICITNSLPKDSYRLQLTASAYFASPSAIEWAEIHRIDMPLEFNESNYTCIYVKKSQFLVNCARGRHIGYY